MGRYGRSKNVGLMRSVLFHYTSLNPGGAEMSTLRMMKALADRGWQITLVLTTGGGALEGAIDPRVRVVRLRPRAFGQYFLTARSSAARVRALPDLLGYALMRGIGVARMLPFFFRRYDAAAVLLMGTPSGFVRRVVRADVKIQWIRNDLSGADPTGRVAAALSRAEQGLHYFVCVSEVARRALVAAVPTAAAKAVVIYNILDADTMRARAREGPNPFPPRREGHLRVLTLCRLSDRAKGLLRMVRVCQQLAERGHDFTWYVAGDGPDRGLLENAIHVAGQKSRMVMLGALANPFPAYAHADVVAMLSNYEGLSGVVNEARVIGRPVVATRVSGIDEQLSDGVNGLVVENDEDAILTGMERLLSDGELRARLAAGGYSAALLDDEAKLDRLERLFRSEPA